ncbi:MAG: hypothetical protein F8N39_07220 [Clostridiaceae bacterium]|nr:hypothetical protein [Clostridiaceae bacterium]
MARIRTIKPDFFRHAELFDLERETGFPMRVAFAGLWTCADREGRFRWEPRKLKLDCLPYDDVDFEKVLLLLDRAGFIQRYSVAGHQYAWIPSFSAHQVINQREARSVIPAPDPHDNACECTETHVHAHGEGEEEREEDSVADATDAASASVSAPDPEDDEEEDLKAVLFGPGLRWLGKHSGKDESACRTLIGKWVKSHGEDVTLQALRAARKCRDGPPIQPVSWITGWLKEQDHGEADKTVKGKNTSGADELFLRHAARANQRRLGVVGNS